MAAGAGRQRSAGSYHEREVRQEVMWTVHSRTNSRPWPRELSETRERERIEAQTVAVRSTLSKEISRLTDELADSARKPAAADLVIRELTSSR